MNEDRSQYGEQPMTVPDLTPNLTDSQKININVISLNTRVNEHETEINKLKRIVVEGDGEILPHAERIRNLESYANTTKFWLRTVAVAIVLQTITFGSAAIFYFVKLYPVLLELAKKP